MLMVFVDNVGGWFQGWIDHSPWDVVHLADFVMPLFLFMVGVSMGVPPPISAPATTTVTYARLLLLFRLRRFSFRCSIYISLTCACAALAAFSMKKYTGPALKWKVLSRTIKLFVLGCLTQGKKRSPSPIIFLIKTHTHTMMICQDRLGTTAKEKQPSHSGRRFFRWMLLIQARISGWVATAST